jgi:tetratricopeptide (TPR) repeat protein
MKKLRLSILSATALLSTNFGACDSEIRGNASGVGEAQGPKECALSKLPDRALVNVFSYLGVEYLQKMGVTSHHTHSAMLARASLQLVNMINNEKLSESHRTALHLLNCPAMYINNLELRLAFVLNTLHEWYKFNPEKRNQLDEQIINPRLMLMANTEVIPQGISYLLMALSMNSDLNDLFTALEQALQLGSSDLVPFFIQRIATAPAGEVDKLKRLAEIFAVYSVDCPLAIDMLGRVCNDPRKVTTQLYKVAVDALERELEEPSTEGREIAINACRLFTSHPKASYFRLRNLAEMLTDLAETQEAINIIIQLSNRPNISSSELEGLADKLISLGAREHAVEVLVKSGRAHSASKQFQGLAERLISLDARDQAIEILCKAANSEEDYVDHRKIAARLYEIGAKQQAVDILIEYGDKILLHKDIYTFNKLCNIAEDLRDYGYKDKAQDILNKMFAQREAFLYAGIVELVNFGYILLNVGERDKAIQVAEEIYAKYENSSSSLPNKGYASPQPFISLGYLFYRLDKDLSSTDRYYEKARASYLIAMKIMEGRQASAFATYEYEDLAEGLIELGEAELKEEAIKLYRKMIRAYPRKEEWVSKRIARLTSDDASAVGS